MNKDILVTIIKSWVEQFALVIQSPDVKQYIEGLVIDPFINYIMNRTFPYIMIAVCLFSGIFLFVLLTFVLTLYKSPTSVVKNGLQHFMCPNCSHI
jgi:hypothetical protein